MSRIWNVLVAVLLCAMALGAQGQQDAFPLPPKEWPQPVKDQPLIPFFLIDRLEYRWQPGENAALWDVQAWLGGDYNKLWFKSEGQAIPGNGTEEADVELLYARLVSPFWYLQAGLREDIEPTPARTSLAFGIQGLAPYWFQVEAFGYLSQQGVLSARLETEYDMLLTQRLILQPRAEAWLASSDDSQRGVGQGFNSLDLGLRLRYEIRRQFAPYIGVNWSRKFGQTADFAHQAGQSVEATAFVAGVRIWF